jgi:hypothetical protein
LEAIQVLKKPGRTLKDSFLDEGYVLLNFVLNLLLLHAPTYDDLLSLKFQLLVASSLSKSLIKVACCFFSAMNLNGNTWVIIQCFYFLGSFLTRTLALGSQSVLRMPKFWVQTLLWTQIKLRYMEHMFEWIQCLRLQKLKLLRNTK